MTSQAFCPLGHTLEHALAGYGSHFPWAWYNFVLLWFFFTSFGFVVFIKSVMFKSLEALNIVY